MQVEGQVELSVALVIEIIMDGALKFLVLIVSGIENLVPLGKV